MDLLKERFLIPVVLTTMILSEILYNFVWGSILMLTSLCALVYIISLFFFFDKVNNIKDKRIATPMVLLLMAVIYSICYFLICTQAFGKHSLFEDYITWFFYSQKGSAAPIPYVAVLVLIFGFIFAAIIFYYSSVRYRVLYVLILCLIPQIIYATSYKDIPYGYMTTVFLLFIIWVIKRQHQLKGKSWRIVGNKEYYGTLVIFLLTVIMISSFLPRLKYTPYRSAMDQFLRNTTVSKESYSNYTQSSGNNDLINEQNQRILFKVKTAKPVHLRRQVFDIWNGSQWRPLSLDQYMGGYAEWETTNLDGSSEYVLKFIEEMDGRETYSKLANTREQTILVERVSPGTSNMILVPSDVKSITLSKNYQNEIIYKTIKDEYFTDYDRTINDSYEVIYYDNAYDENFFSEVDMNLFLSTYEKGSSSKDYRKDVLLEAYGQYLNSETYPYFAAREYPGQGRVKALAEEITAGSANDYEKASSLEQYFHSGEFQYDLEFKREEGGIEAFLFEDKKGSCFEFATAMTLMAREVGLKARYVEGFLFSEEDKGIDGNYILRVKNSHAFPEIYLGVAGWKIFEPTIASDSGKTSIFEHLNFSLHNSFSLVIGILSMVGILIAVTVVKISPKVKEVIFFMGIKNQRGVAQLLPIYGKARALMEKNLGLKRNTLSSQEMILFAKKEYDVDLKIIGDDYDKVIFGEKLIEQKDYLHIYQEFIKKIKEMEKYP